MKKPRIREAKPKDIATLVAHAAEIPGVDPRDADWFAARQHLVLIDHGCAVGHTSWMQHDGFITWDETYLEPPYRKRGFGRKLMEARAERTPGLVFGACKPENEAMVHLLASMGFHPCLTIPDGYSDGAAILWSREHQGR